MKLKIIRALKQLGYKEYDFLSYAASKPTINLRELRQSVRAQIETFQIKPLNPQGLDGHFMLWGFFDNKDPLKIIKLKALADKLNDINPKFEAVVKGGMILI